MECFLPKIRNKARCIWFLLLLKTVVADLVDVIREETETRSMRMGMKKYNSSLSM